MGTQLRDNITKIYDKSKFNGEKHFTCTVVKIVKTQRSKKMENQNKCNISYHP